MLACRASERERSGPPFSVNDLESALGPVDFASHRDKMKETLVRTVKLEGQKALNPHCLSALSRG